jgi:hypothetical protein
MPAVWLDLGQPSGVGCASYGALPGSAGVFPVCKLRIIPAILSTIDH